MTIDALWVTWEGHRRTRTMATALGVELRELDAPGGFPLRHLVLTIRTLVLLLRTTRPVVMVQNPSLVLSLLAVLVRRLRGWRLVVDAHNEAVSPFIGRSALRRRITDHVIRSADLTIVTNDSLAARVHASGGTPVVLPDRLPRPGGSDPERRFRLQPGTRHAMLISTFAPDEPLGAVLTAMRTLTGVTLHVSGDHDRLPRSQFEDLPPNVVLTGFLADDDYWDLLRAVEVVVDLTLMDDCLVCGAYEAVAAGTPAVLTDGPETRKLFRKGVVYAHADPVAIGAALSEALLHREELAAELHDLAAEMNRDWNRQAEALRQRMRALLDPASTSGDLSCER